MDLLTVALHALLTRWWRSDRGPCPNDSSLISRITPNNPSKLLKMQVIYCPNLAELDSEQLATLMAFSTSIERYRKVQIILIRSARCPLFHFNWTSFDHSNASRKSTGPSCQFSHAQTRFCYLILKCSWGLKPIFLLRMLAKFAIRHAKKFRLSQVQVEELSIFCWLWLIRLIRA